MFANSTKVTRMGLLPHFADGIMQRPDRVFGLLSLGDYLRPESKHEGMSVAMYGLQNLTLLDVALPHHYSLPRGES